MNDKQTKAAGKASEAATVPVDPTGVPNLDRLIGGGLLRGALAIVVGPPGSGKTTLANQVAFTAAHAGRRVVVLTAFSESTSKLIAHLHTFRFCEEELIGDAIQFLSLEQFLSEGLETMSDKVIAMVRQTRSGLVILDGFRGVRGASPSPQTARRFLYEVGAALSALRATTIVTSEANPHDPSFFPEATTADVVIGLYHELVGVRQHRTIEVIKARGTAPLTGLHSMTLDSNGVMIYPRLEARVAEIPRASAEDDQAHIRAELNDRASFNLAELDALLGGGLTRGTSTLVLGHLGTGKTLLALHFALAGVRAGEPTLFLGFRETRHQLLLSTGAFDLGPALHRALQPGGGLTLLRFPPVELQVDVVADQFLDALHRTGARRLVVDSVAELERAVTENGDTGRLKNYLAALLEVLRARGVTTLFIKEAHQVIFQELNFAEEPLSIIAENVLLLQRMMYGSRLHRVLSVLKMHFSAHDFALREFIIAPPEGIRVLGLFESGPEVLTGIAREQSEPAPGALWDYPRGELRAEHERPPGVMIPPTLENTVSKETP
jgi:circadian clock protein KaiC